MNNLPEVAFHVMKLMAEKDDHDNIWWTFDPKEGFKFFAICSDWFHWGSADFEEITMENFHILEQSYLDEEANSDYTGIYATCLFASRIRKMRPMKQAYQKLNDGLKILFDACGPARD